MGSAEDIYGSAASGDRVVAIGDNSSVDPVIWASTNGREWTVADLSFFPGYAQLNDVSAYQYGFMVVGSVDINSKNIPFVLKSNDGITWEFDQMPNLADGTFTNVASVGSTSVIYGNSNLQSGFVVSHDAGGSWGPLSDPDGVTTNGLGALTATNDAFWAFSAASGSKPDIQVWRSTDGESWTVMGTIPGSARVEDLQVAEGPLGWVALGDNTQKKQINYGWWSADGINWQASQNPPFAFSDVFADNAGFVDVGKWLPKPSGCALDPAEYAGVSWTSTDGLLWTRMPDEGWQSHWIEQLRRYNRTLIGIGIDYSGANDEGLGAIWTAKLPDIAANSGPTPSNPPTPGPGGC
jgi:hypothetical protein